MSRKAFFRTSDLVGTIIVLEQNRHLSRVVFRMYHSLLGYHSLRVKTPSVSHQEVKRDVGCLVSECSVSRLLKEFTIFVK